MFPVDITPRLGKMSKPYSNRRPRIDDIIFVVATHGESVAMMTLPCIAPIPCDQFSVFL